MSDSTTTTTTTTKPPMAADAAVGRLIYPAPPPPRWTASWIDAAGVETCRPAFFLARRRVQCDGRPSRAVLHIAADSLYRLHLNGRLVGRGPARGTLARTFLDTYDVTDLLRPGANHVAVTVASPNVHNFKYAPPRPGLLVQLDLDDVPGIGTDATWQTRLATEWQTPTPEYNFQMGFCEHLDARAVPDGWETGSDDAAWQPARVLGPAESYAGRTLLPRDIPALVERRLQAKPIGPTSGRRLLFDATDVFTAGIELEVDGPGGCVVEVAYDDGLVDGWVRGALDSRHWRYRFIDRYITRPGRHVLGPTLAERGGRYVAVTLSETDPPTTVTRVTAIDRRYPLPRPASPPSVAHRDVELRRIHDACVRTIHACATDTLVDCPWRESATWVNDFAVLVPSWLAAGGDPALVARSLRLAFSQQGADGLVPAVIPCPTRPQSDGLDAPATLTFPATNAYLPLVVEDHDAVAARPLAPELLGPLGRVFDALAAMAEPDGTLRPPPRYWNFVDWSFTFVGADTGGRNTACVNWFYVLGLDALARLHRSAGDPAAAAAYADRAAAVAAAVHARFWDDAAGAYREGDGVTARGAPLIAQLAQALALRSGRAPADARPPLVAALLGDRAVPPELFMLRYVLEALVAAGHDDAAIAIIRKYWGVIVATDDPAPTICEANVHQHGAAAFSRSGTHCHGFATAPLLVLRQIADRSARG